MVRTSRAATLLAVAILALSGCFAVEPFRVAQTPEQQFYAALGSYAIVGALAVEYVQGPTADPTIVDRIRKVDATAHSIISEGRAIVTSPDRPPESDARLEILSIALRALIGKLQSDLAMGAQK